MKGAARKRTARAGRSNKPLNGRNGSSAPRVRSGGGGLHGSRFRGGLLGDPEDGGGNGDGAFFNQLTGVPIEYLIATPLIASARANLALAQVMAEFINSIGFDGDQVRVLTFELTRWFTPPEGGAPVPQTVEVHAPLLSLIPVPALLIQSVNVDLTVEISDTNVQKVESSTEAKVDIEAGWLFDKVTFNGTYTNSQSNTRTTNQSAKYEVNVVATQQQLPEGMSKLLDLMSSCIEGAPKT